MKTEKNVFVGLSVAVFGLVFFGAAPAQAAFPQDQAGIAAYVKLTSISQTNFDNALKNFFDYTEPSGDTYLIGVKGYTVDNLPYDPYARNKIDVHFYLGVDGWLAAYLPKAEPAAKIVNWRDGAELKNTLLEVALNDAIGKIGVATTEEIKYYDFSSPASLKMTMVKEFSPANDKDESDNLIRSNEFSAMIKGQLNRFSWSVQGIGTYCASGGWMMPINLSIDGYTSIGDAGCSRFTYGNYDSSASIFNDQKSHIVKMYKNDYDKGAIGVFVFVYGN